MNAPEEWPAGQLHAELAGLLLSEQTVSDLLAMVVDLAISTIDDVAGSSVSLMRPNGRLETSSASSETMRLVDEAQYHDGLGPCVEAINTGRETTITLPADRWPEFSDRATEAGMRSVHSFPLQVRSETTGALNLYSAHPTPIAGAQATAARALARQAATVLANAAALTTAELANEHLRLALANRDLIGQAKGILMEREHIDADAAFDLLRRVSQQTGRKLTDIASELAGPASD